MQTALEGQAFCQILYKMFQGPMEIKHRCYGHSICPWEQLRQKNECLINIKIYEVWWRRTRIGGLRSRTRASSSKVTYLKRAEATERTELSAWLNPTGCSPISQLLPDRGGAFVLFVPHRSHHKTWAKCWRCNGEHSHFRGAGRGGWASEELGTFSWDGVSDLWE